MPRCKCICVYSGLKEISTFPALLFFFACKSFPFIYAESRNNFDFILSVIKRLVALICTNAVLEAEHEAAMKQASSASKAAEALLKDAPAPGQDSELEKKLKDKDQELKKALKDVASMKTQSDNLAKEYDRLMEEKDKLERRLRVLDGGAAGDKKGD